MKSDLAIATLIRSRLTELGLSRGEFAKRLGYKNIAKGIRRIDAMFEGDIKGTKQFMDVLPQALETSAEIVTLALDQTVRDIELAEKHEAEARDKSWRENFRPHAIILTERTVPSPIFVAAIIGRCSGPGEFRAAGAGSPSRRGPRVWQTYWICNQLFAGQSGQVRFKWATNRNAG
jgi:hypothetical protein